MTFEPFLVTFYPFNHLEPFWSQKQRVKKWPKIGPKWAKNRSKIGHFGVILDHFWVDPGSFRGHLGIILASFWHHFGVVLVSFRPHFEAFLGPFGAIFGPFLGLFRPF